MKTIKRLTVLTGTVVLAGTLLSPSAFAATGVWPDGTSAGNGRDHGWGNCGLNNGGQAKLTGQELRAAHGMGGHKKGDACSTDQAPPVPTTPTATGTTTGTTPTPDETTDTDMTSNLGTVGGTYA